MRGHRAGWRKGWALAPVGGLQDRCRARGRGGRWRGRARGRWRWGAGVAPAWWRRPTGANRGGRRFRSGGRYSGRAGRLHRHRTSRRRARRRGRRRMPRAGHRRRGRGHSARVPGWSAAGSGRNRPAGARDRSGSGWRRARSRGAGGWSRGNRGRRGGSPPAYRSPPRWGSASGPAIVAPRRRSNRARRRAGARGRCPTRCHPGIAPGPRRG